MPMLLHCHRGIGPEVTGTALVAADNFSARYDLDRERGIFSRPSHNLAGQSYADRILVFHKGRLREQGAHQELLTQRGIYYRLYQLQYKEQELHVPVSAPDATPLSALPSPQPASD